MMGVPLITLRFRTVVPRPVLFESVMVYAVEEDATLAVPVMLHVALMLRPVGRAGEMRQPDTVPVVVAVCEAAKPIVSTTVEGLYDTVGLGMSTARFRTVVPRPVLFESVMVYAVEADAT